MSSWRISGIGRNLDVEGVEEINCKASYFWGDFFGLGWNCTTTFIRRAPTKLYALGCPDPTIAICSSVGQPPTFSQG